VGGSDEAHGVVARGGAQGKADLAVRDSQLAAANEMLIRERDEHDKALKNMEITFENMSNRVLAHTSSSSISPGAGGEGADSKLDLTSSPRVAAGRVQEESGRVQQGAHRCLFDVKNRAAELLQAQHKSQEETRRLNQLLGRGDQRANGRGAAGQRHGRVGLRRNIDYDLQVSGVNDAGRALRPDCVVKMPNNASIAIDAKFPFDAFEAANATEDASFVASSTSSTPRVAQPREDAEGEVVLGAHLPGARVRGLLRAERLRHHGRFRCRSDAALVRREGAGPDSRPTNLLSLLWSVPWS